MTASTQGPEQQQPAVRNGGTTGRHRVLGGQSSLSVSLGCVGKLGSGREPQIPTAQQPARQGAGRAGWCWLLGIQQPHVGGLGALRPRRHVELDGLPLIK
jgi:hypothetical protein